ncbi:hypothetical protein ENBRE01_0402 [Enteropsectra breve]|nr:hypothetical protein ENBRE01_0402 [Enteropsectra breve]
MYSLVILPADINIDGFSEIECSETLCIKFESLLGAEEEVRGVMQAFWKIKKELEMKINRLRGGDKEPLPLIDLAVKHFKLPSYAYGNMEGAIETLKKEAEELKQLLKAEAVEYENMNSREKIMVDAEAYNRLKLGLSDFTSQIVFIAGKAESKQLGKIKELLDDCCIYKLDISQNLYHLYTINSKYEAVLKIIQRYCKIVPIEKIAMRDNADLKEKCALRLIKMLQQANICYLNSAFQVGFVDSLLRYGMPVRYKFKFYENTLKKTQKILKGKITKVMGAEKVFTALEICK